MMWEDITPNSFDDDDEIVQPLKALETNARTTTPTDVGLEFAEEKEENEEEHSNVYYSHSECTADLDLTKGAILETEPVEEKAKRKTANQERELSPPIERKRPYDSTTVVANVGPLKSNNKDIRSGGCGSNSDKANQTIATSDDGGAPHQEELQPQDGPDKDGSLIMSEFAMNPSSFRDAHPTRNHDLDQNNEDLVKEIPNPQSSRTAISTAVGAAQATDTQQQQQHAGVLDQKEPWSTTTNTALTASTSRTDIRPSKAAPTSPTILPRTDDEAYSHDLVSGCTTQLTDFVIPMGSGHATTTTSTPPPRQPRRLHVPDLHHEPYVHQEEEILFYYQESVTTSDQNHNDMTSINNKVMSININNNYKNQSPNHGNGSSLDDSGNDNDDRNIMKLQHEQRKEREKELLHQEIIVQKQQQQQQQQQIGTNLRIIDDGSVSTITNVLHGPTSILTAHQENLSPQHVTPWYKNPRLRRCCVYGTVLFVLGLLIVTIVSILILRPSMNHDSEAIRQPPTISPTSFRELLGIQKVLESFVPKSILYDVTTPHNRAMNWIINDDPLQLQPDDSNFIQRYFLVVLYYATTKDKLWEFCNPPNPNNNEDHTCFMKLWDSTRRATIRYLTGFHECYWAGVYCNEFNQTIDIRLEHQKITGTLPMELVHLPHLQSIYLGYNYFTGTLHMEYSFIKRLSLEYNQLSGSIPDGWWDLPKEWEQIHLFGNYLTGTIPTKIGRMSSLRTFRIDNNYFSGTIPTEIGLISHLGILSCRKNLFEGTIPTEIGRLTLLQHFLMDRTDLSGAIPSEIGQLPRLSVLDLHSTSLQGEIPSGLWSSSHLRELRLSNTHLEGTISTHVGLMSILKILDVSNSNLVGTIPSELGQVPLAEASFHLNNFRGSIPMEVCHRRGPYKGYNLLVLKADCTRSEATGHPAVECLKGCCTTCCDNETGECEI